MLSLSPTLNFQKQNTGAAAELAQTIRTSWMPTALIYAISQMTFNGATKEELKGARDFIVVLMNLAEPIEAIKSPLPSKELGQTLPETKTT